MRKAENYLDEMAMFFSDHGCIQRTYDDLKFDELFYDEDEYFEANTRKKKKTSNY